MRRLDHVVIHVSAFDRSNSFYRDVLGAEIVEVGGRIAYRFGDQQLNVHGPGVQPVMVARVPVAPGNSDLCFEWSGDIDGAIAHLREHCVAIEAGPLVRTGARGRGTSVYFRDPDGSLLEFISYAQASGTASEDGSVGATAEQARAATVEMGEGRTPRPRPARGSRLRA